MTNAPYTLAFSNGTVYNAGTQYLIGTMMTATESCNEFFVPVTGGAGPCPNGATRQGQLTITCGAPTTSFSVTENPVCTYAMNYVTSQACPPGTTICPSPPPPPLPPSPPPRPPPPYPPTIAYTECKYYFIFVQDPTIIPEPYVIDPKSLSGNNVTGVYMKLDPSYTTSSSCALVCSPYTLWYWNYNQNMCACVDPVVMKFVGNTCTWNWRSVCGWNKHFERNHLWIIKCHLHHSSSSKPAATPEPASFATASV